MTFPCCAHFINKYNVEFNKKFDRVDRKAMDFMMDYHWPGNVRELENVIERAIVIDQGPQMKVKHLPFCNIESPLSSTLHKKIKKFGLERQQ
jgi:transcriptional regulator with PAS, ATPase and Fis domain